MPRINRRRPMLKTRGLSLVQRQMLMWGCQLSPMTEPDAFASEAEMRAAWNEYRDEIMAALRAPGRRPFAYYKFDLRIDDPPVNWFTELPVLVKHDLLTKEEIIALENERQVLGLDDSAFAAYDTEAGARRAMHLGSPSVMMTTEQTLVELRRLAGTFEAATLWHSWRHRPEMADRFRRRAEIVRGVSPQERAA